MSLDNLVNYGQVLNALDAGHKATRLGWNGKDQYLFLIRADNYCFNIFPDHITRVDWIGIKTSKGTFGPYVASNCDQLAKDWVIINEEI